MAEHKVLDDCHPMGEEEQLLQCQTMAEILIKYREYLIKEIQESSLIRQLKPVIDSSEFSYICGQGDKAQAALYLVIRKLEGGYPQPFDTLLNHFHELSPKTESALRERKNGIKRRTLSPEDYTSVVNKHAPSILSWLSRRDHMSDLSGALSVKESSDILNFEGRKAQASAFLSLLTTNLTAGHLLLWNLLLEVLGETEPDLHDQITESLETGEKEEGKKGQEGQEGKEGEEGEEQEEKEEEDQCRLDEGDENKDYQRRFQTLERCRELEGLKEKFNNNWRLLHTLPYEIKYNVVLDFESDPLECVIECITDEMDAGLHDIYDEFIKAISRVNFESLSKILERCQFAKITLQKNMPYLVHTLDFDSLSEAIEMSSDEADIIASKIEKKRRIAEFLHFVDKRLDVGDASLFERFMEALAGLDHVSFHTLSGRAATVEEAEYCIRSHIKDLKNTIIQVGHQTDKQRDRRIDLEMNYVKLRVKPKVTDGSKLSSPHTRDNVHPMTYQSELPQGDRDIEDVMGVFHGETIFSLIQGRCGIGKTTMAQHMCRRWAKGKCMKQFSYLFLILIRRLMLFKHPMSLHALLTRHSLYRNKLPLNWLENWPHQVLINLDGLDELGNLSEKLHNTRIIRDISEEALPEELIVNLLKRNLLPRATICCTSRPFAALSKLQPNQELEVMGLTQDGVIQYIEKNVEPEDQTRVKSTLGKNPLLMSVCSITYYACALSIILARKQSLSSKDTDTYSRLTAALIRAYPLRETDESHDQIRCMKSYPVLAEIALHGDLQDERETGLKNISFDLEDILDIQAPEVAESIKLAEAYGLVQIADVVCDEINRETKRILEFPHLSLQEFFAAFQFLKASNEMGLSVDQKIKDLLETGSLDMFQLFIFAAAMDTESKDLKQMRKCIFGRTNKDAIEEKNKDIIKKGFQILLRGERENMKFMKACQIAYEAQQTDLARAVSKWFVGKEDLSIQATPLNALDLKAFANVFDSCKLKQIKLSQVNLDCYSVSILVHSQKGNEALTCLNLSYNQIMEDGLTALSELLETLPGLQELNLNGNSISSLALGRLLPGLKKKRDVFGFFIGENDIQDKGAEDIALALLNTKSLTALDVSHNLIGQRGMAALGDLIRQTGPPLSLKCDGNAAGDELIQCLFADSQNTSKLRCLSLEDTLVTSAGVNTIAKNIHRVDNECSIRLSDCQIGTASAQNLIDKTRGSMIHLDLKKNHIDVNKLDRYGDVELLGNACGRESVRRIMNKISGGKEFPSLNLSDCKIGDLDGQMLTKALINSHTLQELCLQDNDITDKVVVGLTHLAFTCPNLSKIDLSSTEVEEENKRMFSDMSIRYSAETLDLSKLGISVRGANYLTDIMEKSNIKLRSLKVDNCSIEEEHCSHFSHALEKNETVEEFILANNRINSGGASVLARALTHNSTLKTLDLSANGIGDEGVKAVSAALAENTSLTKIDISFNRIGDEGGMAVAALLSKNMTLSEIKLGRNKIGDKAGKAIAAALPQNQTLTELHLDNNQIGGSGCEAIAAALAQNTSLIQIDLSSNRIGDRGGKAIADALAQNSTLAEIAIGDNQVGIVGGKAIGVALAQNSSIRKVDLGDNHIGAEGGKAFATALIQNSSLTQIDMSDNEIGVVGGKAIANALASNSSLTHINLCSNAIGDDAGKAIAFALTENSAITEINIGDNCIGDGAAKVFALALAQDVSLTQIDLSSNRISSVGGKAIAVSLVQNLSLEEINISNNLIGDEGGKAFATALAENSNLTHIDISSNRMVGSGGEDIAAAFRKNPSLRRVNIGGNRIYHEGGMEIVAALAQTSSLTEINLSECSVGDFVVTAIAHAFVQYSTLTKLNLSSNEIGDHGGQAIAKALAQNSSLTQINLSINRIGGIGGKAIAEALAQNLSLTQIDLCFNCLGKEGGKAIAEALAQNSSLTKIYLGNNGIGPEGGEFIPAALAKNSALTHIDLSSNYLCAKGTKAIAAALAHNTSLTQIDLSSNRIGDEGGKAIGATLAKNTALTQIDLSNNMIGDEGGNAIADALAQNSSLTQIDLEDNEIGAEGGKAIAAALAQNSSLKEIDMSFGEIGLDGVKAIAAALGTRSALTRIDLSYTMMGEDGGKVIAGALEENLSLREIDLSYNGLGTEGGKAIAAALAQNSSLIDMNISSNDIGAEGGEAIAAALTQNSTLTQIDLSCNIIGDEGGIAIAASMRENTSLTRIDLSSNDIGNEGVKAFAAALAKNTSVTEVDIGENGICDEGVEAIATALAENISLVEINLSHGEIRNEGGKAIATALARNSSLTKIDLSYNRVGNEGIKAIATAIKKNSSLTEINLSSNRIGEEGGKALAVALAQNTSISQIDIGDNRIGDAGGKAIATMLAQNSYLTSVDLSSNGIGDEGGIAIAVSLAHNSSLTKLNLSSNRIGAGAARAIADTVGKNTDLCHIDLSGIKISDKSFDAIHSAQLKRRIVTPIDFLGMRVADLKCQHIN